MGDTALVTGASGFIGSHLVDLLRAEGFDVVGVGRRPQPDVAYRYEPVDLANRDEARALVARVRPAHIFHLAGDVNHATDWPTQRKIIGGHFLSTTYLAEAATELKTPLESFVSVGSSDEYGALAAPQSESQREMPIAPYSAAKVASTHYLQMLHRTLGFPAVTARFFLVYGPRQGTARLLPYVIKTLLEGSVVESTDGKQRRDFLYVSDAVRGLLALARTPGTRGKVFNVASGTPLPVREFLEVAREHVGTGEIRFGAKPRRAGEQDELYADIRAITAATGWRPSVTLADGMKLTVDSFRG